MRYWVETNYRLSRPFHTLQESIAWYINCLLSGKSKGLSEKEHKLRTCVDPDTRPVVPTSNALYNMLHLEVWETVADEMPDRPPTGEDDYWMPDDEEGVRRVSQEEVDSAISATPGGEAMKQRIRDQFDLIHRLSVAQARFWEENQEKWRVVRWHKMRGLQPPPSVAVPSPEANVCDIVLTDSSGNPPKHSPFAAGIHVSRQGTPYRKCG